MSGSYGDATITSNNGRLSGKWRNGRKDFSGYTNESCIGMILFPDAKAFVFEYDKKQCVIFFNGRGKGLEWKKSFC